MPPPLVRSPSGNPERQKPRLESPMRYGQVDRALSALRVRLRECLVLRELEELPTRILRRSRACRLKRSCPSFRARQALARMGATTAAALGRGTGGATLSAVP